MMQIHLYCPDCLAESHGKGSKIGVARPDPILSDVYELLNDGVYTIHCSKGHTCKVVLDNLSFELLFDLGINAIGDRYYREGVASITAALERFYEFFIKTIWRVQGIDFKVIDKNWKEMSNSSERQLGAYIAAYSFAFGEVAPVMNDKQKNFRNCVIHKGEIPTRERTVEFAGYILSLIDGVLEKTRVQFGDALAEAYKHYTPSYETKDPDENVLIINHPTIIRAKDPLPDDDKRKKRDIEYLIDKVLSDRHPHRIWFIDDEEKGKVSENYEKWLSQRLENQNQEVENNELQVVIDPNASVEKCLDLLEEQLLGYDCILASLYEDYPSLFSNDSMTVYLGNVQLKAQLYFLYVKVRVYQQLLKDNPQDKEIKDEYERVEQELREYHCHLSSFD